MAVAGFALIRRRLRQKFGIAAQKVSIRSHLPWHWRAVLLVALVCLALLLVVWIYDAGRRFAGDDRAGGDEDVAQLRARIKVLERELEGLRTVARSSDSRLQVEATTQDQLAIQLKILQRDNAALKEDLALFEGLIAGGGQTGGIRIATVSIEPAGKSDRWRYRVLIVNPGSVKGSREEKGSVRFQLATRFEGKDGSISIPSQADMASFDFSVKHFQRVEGEFAMPPGATIKSGEIQLVQGGAIKARQALDL